jgi:hypothetical protein
LAWLQTTLDRVEGDKKDAPQETRLEGQRRVWHPDQEWLDMVSQETYEAIRDNWMPELPPIEFGVHLVSILFEIGPTVSSGMGGGPIEWPHIDAWCNRSGIDLLPWESRAIVHLSKVYLSESQKSSKHFYPPPWTDPESI